MDPKALMEAVREACPAGYWSRGVKLARGGAVVGQSADEEEVVLRVSVPGAPVAFTVHLWPEDEDWGCDCPSDHDACAHAAAAVIAWSQSLREGRTLPTASAVAWRVGYRLARAEQGLRLVRVQVRGADERPIRGSLRGSANRAGTLITDEIDLEIEEAVGQTWGEVIRRERALRVLSALAEAGDVRLDGQPVRTDARPVLPVGRVEDDGRGFKLRIVRDGCIAEVFRDGVVRCEVDGTSVLRAVGDAGLAREQRTLLSRGLHFEPGEVGRLVAEVLPDLRRYVPVQVLTQRLPDAETSKPRLVVHTRADGDELIARAEVVYGDPPSARVERGELVLLGGRVPLRDRRAEGRLATEASEQLGLPVGLERRHPGEQGVRFVDRLQGFRGERAGEGWRGFQRAPAFEPQVQVNGDRLHVDMAGADPARVIRAWMEGHSLVPVAGGWAPLPVGWLEQHGHLVADLLAARDPDGSVPRVALMDLGRLAEALDQPPPPALGGLRALVDDFTELPQVPPPADLRATLRHYQRAGVSWLDFLGRAELGGILADDMGLGKTLQALCALRGRSLVVAPTSVLPNWAAEARRFRPGLKLSVYHGPGRALDPDADLTLTTYGLLRNDVEQLSAQEWGTVVLDEGQAIKNPDSQVARAAFRLRGQVRFSLTGTPIENRLEELWSQLHFAVPGLLGGRKDFRERYEKPIAEGDGSVAAHLRRRIRPFVLRRLKAEVAPELPPRTEIVLHATLSAEERAVYDAVRAATRATVLEKLGQRGGVMAALEALLRLRQAACHRGLLPGQSAESSSKVDLLVDTLSQVVAEGHKALVFSQWTGMLDRIQPHLDRAGIGTTRLDGSTRDRGAVVARFQDPDGPPVFLVSLKAGGTGLNLTAADHVFLVDPWWNPATEDQAADRAHRIGQDRPVLVARLVADDTVEERILALQERKRAVAEAALGQGTGAAITRADLMELLG